MLCRRSVVYSYLISARVLWPPDTLPADSIDLWITQDANGCIGAELRLIGS